jgi:hypothetical protein
MVEGIRTIVMIRVIWKLGMMMLERRKRGVIGWGGRRIERRRLGWIGWQRQRESGREYEMRWYISDVCL